MARAFQKDTFPPWKHVWDKPFAGTVRVRRELVSKCEAGIPLEVKSQLLADAIEWSPRRWSKSYPKRLYNVYCGIPYEATATNPGRSWHAFPASAVELRDDSRLRDVVVLLRERAAREGYLDRFDGWVKRGRDSREGRDE